MRRGFVSLASAVALCASFVLVGTSPIAYANTTCDQTAPSADVSVSQTASLHATTPPTVTYSVVLANILGPCKAPNVGLLDTTPAPIVSVTVSPPGWNCDFVIGGTSVACDHNPLGVGQTVTVDITTGLPTGDPTNTAIATVGGSSACTAGSTAPTCDPNPDNNLSSGGVVTDAATDRTIHTPKAGQWTELGVPPGHTLAASIQQLSQSLCPPGFHSCFGKLVSIFSASTAPDLQTKVFVYPLSLVTSYNSATIRHLDTTGTWVVPLPCKGQVLPDPCLLTKERFKSLGVTYVRFVVLTTTDDSWMGDQ